jgi:hypothetical protein
MQNNKILSQAHLSRVTGSDRKDIRRWLADAGLTLSSSEADCLACIEAHQRKPLPQAALDGNAALPWRLASVRQDVIRMRRENAAAEKVMRETWVSSERHDKVMTGFCNLLSTVPAKAKATLGLTDFQTLGLQKIFDDLFRDYPIKK